MSPDILAAVVEQVRQAEGFLEMPYADSVGVLTIGYGRAIGRIGISREEAELLLQNDINRAIKDLDFGVTWWRTLDDVRQGALLELCFQLGLHGLLAFSRMREALRLHQFDLASDELLDSRLHQQVPGRTARIALMLRTGMAIV
jgi:lysozyme